MRLVVTQLHVDILNVPDVVVLVHRSGSRPPWSASLSRAQLTQIRDFLIKLI